MHWPLSALPVEGWATNSSLRTDIPGGSPSICQLDGSGQLLIAAESVGQQHLPRGPALRSEVRWTRSVSTEEAVKGLEHGAVLLDDQSNDFEPEFPNRPELMKLVRKATGILPRKTGKPVEKVVQEGEAIRIVPVVRGVDLHLTREFKLVKVIMDPHQWQLRSKALSAVGIGQDTATDVAERHDDYLGDAYENG